MFNHITDKKPVVRLRNNWQHFILITFLLAAFSTPMRVSAAAPAPDASPAVASLLNMQVEPSPDGLGTTISWSSINESVVIGYNLYRLSTGQSAYSRLNDETILALNPGDIFGGDYTWIDDTADPYGQHVYILETVQFDGNSTAVFYSYTPPAVRIMLPLVIR